MILKKLTAAFAAAAVFFFTPVAHAECPDRGDEIKLDPSECYSSQIRPSITASKLDIPSDTAPGSVAEVKISISGADEKYCTAGLHIYWDDRLTPVPSRSGSFAVGGAASGALQLIADNIGDYGVFVTTTGIDDYGFDGVLCTIKLMIPYDAQPGDTYPIDIAYRSNDLKSDLFMNNANDETGRLMQAWTFTNGIHSSINPSYDDVLVNAGAQFADGYIHIQPAPTTTETTTSTTTTETTTSTTTTETTTSTTTTETTTSTTTTETTTSTTTTETTTSTTTTETTTSTTTTETTTSTTTTETTTSTTTTETTTSTTTTETTTSTTTTETTTSTTTTTTPELVYKLGDVNHDGIADGRDASAVLTDYAISSTGGSSFLSEKALTAADVNYDGITDGRDASVILSFYAESSTNDSLTIEDYTEKYRRINRLLRR